MRTLCGCLTLLLLSACISGKKVRTISADYEARIDYLNRLSGVQSDSILALALALERSRGGNDMLLVTQDRLQDRLALQDDELEQLRGNLTATSSQMNDRIRDLMNERQATERTLDTLVRAQRRAISAYSEGLRRAANALSDSLETRLPTNRFSLAERPGEIVLSVQEDMLFRPRSVSSLAPESEAVLRAVTDALQANPLLKLSIVGHTDNQPNPRRGTDNREYAALRATALADALATTYYVSPNRIVAASQGESSPLRSNATPEGRAANRRVDFVLTSSLSNLLRDLDKVLEIREQ